MTEYTFSISGKYFYWLRGYVEFTKDISKAEVFDEISDIEILLKSENYESAQEDIRRVMECVNEPIVITTIIKEF